MAAGTTPALVFRRATAADRAALLLLMVELRVQVAGSVSPAAQGALFRAALKDQRAVLMVAANGSELVGVGLGVIDPRRFWKSLALHNPLLAAGRVGALLRRRLKKNTSAVTSAEDAGEVRELLSPRSSRQWGESSMKIAHATIVSLRPEFRGGGAGTRFFSELLEELERCGVTRVDARIARGNVASVRMCNKLGVHVEDVQGSLFATVDLPRSGS